MKNITICGAAGFLGGHLARRLTQEGHNVTGLDNKYPEFIDTTNFSTFNIWDLRTLREDSHLFRNTDEVYQLAAEVGGLGYIMNTANDADCLRNSSLINLKVLEACRYNKVGKVFFASSACVYSSLPSELKDPGGLDAQFEWIDLHRGCREDEVPPANPDNAYAWEKIFAERLYQAYSQCYDMQVRIARFHNYYGPMGTWRGGREKAPAAICRKVAEAVPKSLAAPMLGQWQTDFYEIEVWGDGHQARSFMYVDDAVEGAIRLMASDYQQPLNIGSSEMVTVDQLVGEVMQVSGRPVTIKHVDGPVGVRGRNSDNTLIKQVLGWEPQISLRGGLSRTYPWIKSQVDAVKESV